MKQFFNLSLIVDNGDRNFWERETPLFTLEEFEKIMTNSGFEVEYIPTENRNQNPMFYIKRKELK